MVLQFSPSPNRSLHFRSPSCKRVCYSSFISAKLYSPSQLAPPHSHAPLTSHVCQAHDVDPAAPQVLLLFVFNFPLLLFPSTREINPFPPISTSHFDAPLFIIPCPPVKLLMLPFILFPFFFPVTLCLDIRGGGEGRLMKGKEMEGKQRARKRGEKMYLLCQI